MRDRFFKTLVVALLVAEALGMGPGSSACCWAKNPLNAATQSSPQIRPDILTLKPKDHESELDPDWAQQKQASLEAVAQMLELYPDHEIYFLARDAEFLYDLARALTQVEPSVQSRIHLLNVSRLSMKNPNVGKYLTQEGISVKTLASGKKVLLVDTGFSGTIPAEIKSRFGPKEQEQIGTQLLCSENDEIPSSRAFLTALDPKAAGTRPSAMRRHIIDLEHLPRHYTSRAGTYVYQDRRWIPKASTETDDGEKDVSKRNARKYMEDLLEFARKPETLKQFSFRRAEWNELHNLLVNGNKAQIVSKLQALLAAHPDERSYEAMARDLLETARLRTGLSISPQEIGIALETQKVGGPVSKKSLLDAHPEWKAFLQDPQTAIAKALAKDDLSQLVAIAEVNDDVEFWRLLSDALGKGPLGAQALSFVKEIAETKDVDGTPFNEMVQSLFPNPAMATHPELITAFAQRLSPEQFDIFIGKVLPSRPVNVDHSRERLAILEEVIRVTPSQNLNTTVAHHLMPLFMGPTSASNGVLGTLFERASPSVLGLMAPIYVSLGAEAQPPLRKMIERADLHVLKELEDFLFNASQKQILPEQELFNQRAKELERVRMEAICVNRNIRATVNGNAQ